MAGSQFESTQYLLTLSLVSSVSIGAVACGVQRILRLEVRPFANCIVAAAVIVPIAFMTAARAGIAAELLKTYGLTLVSAAVVLSAGGVMAFLQQAWSREGFAVAQIAERAFANLCLGVAAVATYFVLWVGGWILAVIVELSHCC